MISQGCKQNTYLVHDSVDHWRHPNTLAKLNHTAHDDTDTMSTKKKKIIISSALCTRVHLNTQTANGMCVADFIHNQVGEKEQWSKPRLKCVRTKVGEVDAE